MDALFVEPVRYGRVHPLYGDQIYRQQPHPPSDEEQEEPAVSETLSSEEGSFQSIELEECDTNALETFLSTHAWPQVERRVERVLLIAAERGHLDTVRYLLDRPLLAIDCVDEDRETALFKAVGAGHEQVVEELLSRGSNLLLQNAKGLTILHKAVESGHMGILQQLTASPSFPVLLMTLVDRKGSTALHEAATRSEAMLRHLLKAHGADPSLTNAAGENVYDCAAQAGETGICQLLEEVESVNGGLLTAIDTVWERQRYHSSNNLLDFLHLTPRPSKDGFSAAHLLPSELPFLFPDRIRPQTSPPSSGDFHAVTLPSSRWFWLTTWQIDRKRFRCDADGWRYASSFLAASTEGSNEPKAGDSVRERCWFRVRKRKKSSEAEEAEAEMDYVKRAQRAVVQETEGGEEEEEGGGGERADTAARVLLEGYEKALSLLLSGIRLDEQEERKQRAMQLADHWLKRAQHLQQRIRSSETSSLSALLVSQTSHRAPISLPDHASPAPSVAVPSPATPSSILDRIRGRSDPVEWQPDQTADRCSNRHCRVRFSFFVRRHHCRWCGRVFCNECTSRRIPRLTGMARRSLGLPETTPLNRERVCFRCHETLKDALGPYFSVASLTETETTATVPWTDAGDSSWIRTPSPPSSMEEEELGSCPVCHLSFEQANMVSPAERESHLHACLTQSHPPMMEGNTYIVIRLTEDVTATSPRGTSDETAAECGICYEEFKAGQSVARLNCLCVYHLHCIDEWFGRGHQCPVHYR